MRICFIIILGLCVNNIVFWMMVFLGLGGEMMFFIWVNLFWIFFMRYLEFVNLLMINIVLMLSVCFNCVLINWRIFFIMGLNMDFKFFLVSLIIDVFIVWLCCFLKVFYFLDNWRCRLIDFDEFVFLFLLKVYLIFF